MSRSPGTSSYSRVRNAGVLVGRRVADRVRDVDRRRALVERDLQHLGGELHVGARRVHRRELDVVDERLRVRHRRPRGALDVLARRLQLVLDVDVRRRDERVDPRSLGVAYRVGGTLDVGGLSPREPGDDRSVHLAGDRLDRLEVARRRDREAGLDDVDAQTRQLVRDLELLGRVQRDPGRLLAVAQGGVEDDDPVGVHGLLLCLPRGSFSSWVCGFAAATRYSPRRGRRRRTGRSRRSAIASHSIGRSTRWPEGLDLLSALDTRAVRSVCCRATWREGSLQTSSCAASPNDSGNSSRSTTSTSRCSPASSSPCSARPAAARRRRCG